jgi:hypothetical protein
VKNGNMLSIGPSNSIDSAQFAYTISRVESSDPMNASVPVGRISCVELVATSYPVDTGKPHDGIFNWKRVVPGNAEYFGYSDVLEPGQNVFDDCGRRRFLWD